MTVTQASGLPFAKVNPRVLTTYPKAGQEACAT